MAESLVIDGTTIDRVATGVTLRRCLVWAKGDVPALHFTRVGLTLSAVAPDPWSGKSCVYTLPDGTELFTGRVQAGLTYDANGKGLWCRDYTAWGLKKEGEYVPVSDSVTLTDTARFNVDSDDPDAIPSRQGRNVGQVVTDVLLMVANAQALNGAGLGNYTGLPSSPVLPASTVSDLAALTVILPYEADVAGERILQSLEGYVQQGHPNHWLHVENDGTLRFLDTRAFVSSPVTATLGSAGRWGLPQLLRDVAGCYQRVYVRGGTRANATTLKVKPWPGSANTDGGAQEDFAHDGLTNAQAKAKWKASDFTQPGLPTGQAKALATISGGAVSAVSLSGGGYGYGSAPAVHFSGGGGSGASVTATLSGGTVSGFTGLSGGSGYTSAPAVTIDPPGSGIYDTGTCTCPSTTQVTVTSSNAGVHWGSDYWDQTTSGVKGWVTLYSDVTAGVDQVWMARVTANTALTAGGTSTLTIDQTLPHLNFNAYELFGTGSGAAMVGRKFKTTDAAVGAAMLNYFPFPVPYRTSDGLAATMTSAPTATVILSADGSGNAPYRYTPVGLTVDPESGHVYTNRPVQMVYSIDGVTPVWPDDVSFLLAIATGQLAATYPADVAGVPQYAGDSHAVEGLTRTKTVTVLSWRDYGSQAAMNTFAQELHGALSPAVVEGSIPYFGLATDFLAPGKSLNLAADVYTTGYESAAIPAVGCEVEFHEGADGPNYTSTVHVSSRRAPYAPAAFQRPAMSGVVFLGGAEGMDLSPLGAGLGSAWEGAIGAAMNAGSDHVAAAARAAESLPDPGAALNAMGINTDAGPAVAGGGLAYGGGSVKSGGRDFDAAKLPNTALPDAADPAAAAQQNAARKAEADLAHRERIRDRDPDLYKQIYGQGGES
jgi:hypothetical protein